MLGRILSINQVSADMRPAPMISRYISRRSMDGYAVTTDKHKYMVMIDNSQSCCESWGVVESQDDLNYFVGAQLLEVNLTDTALNTKIMDAVRGWSGESEIQFVTFVTNLGAFQVAVYNSHNGYYGHSVLVMRDETTLLETIL